VLVNLVKKGMTPEQVKALLGLPHLASGDAWGEGWYYLDYGVSVYFLNERSADGGLTGLAKVGGTQWTFDWTR
jgi:SmpA / OmlA family